VCVCVWVLLSCWYLWSLCRPKEFLPHWVRSFFSFRNICLELNSPSGTSTRDSKRRERRKWVVCVGRRSAREKARDIGYKRKEKRRKEMSSLCCPDSFRIDSRKWIFMQFHKKHKRHVSFNILHSWHCSRNSENRRDGSSSSLNHITSTYFLTNLSWSLSMQTYVPWLWDTELKHQWIACNSFQWMKHCSVLCG